MSRRRISELAAAANFPAIAKRYIPDLTESGGAWNGKCPFHEDSTPSFSIFQHEVSGKWIAKCHACEWAAGKDYGDAADFLQEKGLEGRDLVRALGGDVDLPASGAGRMSKPPAPSASGGDVGTDNTTQRQKRWEGAVRSQKACGTDEMTRRYLAGRAGVDLGHLVPPSSPFFDCPDQMWLWIADEQRAVEINPGRRYSRAGFREADPKTGDEIDSIRTVWLNENDEKLREIRDLETGIPSPHYDAKYRAKKIIKRPGEMRRGAVIWGDVAAPIAIIGEGAETMSAIAQCFRTQLDAGDLQIQSTGSASLSAWAVNPAVRRVIIAGDADKSGGRLEENLCKFLVADVREFIGVSPIASPFLANLPFSDAAKIKDFDDLNRICGAEAVEALFAPLLDLGQPLPPSPPRFSGSKSGKERDFRGFPGPSKFGRNIAPDATVVLNSNHQWAQLLYRELKKNFGEELVFSEGKFWHFDADKRVWSALNEESGELPSLIEGKYYYDSGSDEKPSLKPISFSSETRSSAVLLRAGMWLQIKGFFDDAPTGVAVRNGFVHFGKDGVLTFEPEIDASHKITFLHNVDLSPRLLDESFYAARLREDGPFREFIGNLVESLRIRDDDGSVVNERSVSDSLNIIQETFGALLTGARPKRRRALVLQGPQRSGKSMLQELARRLVPGHLATASNPAEWSKPTALGQLIGKVLVTCAESERKIPVPEAKSLIDNNDTLSAKLLYKDLIDFRARATFIFAANSELSAAGMFDKALLDRMNFVVFESSIPAERQREDIIDRIVDKDLDLVLAWALHGAKRLIRQGAYTESMSDEEKKAELFRNSSNAAEFAMTFLVKKAGSRLETADAYAAYQDWCKARKIKQQEILGQRQFNRYVVEAGYRKQQLRIRSGSDEKATYFLDCEIAQTSINALADCDVSADDVIRLIATSTVRLTVPGKDFDRLAALPFLAALKKHPNEMRAQLGIIAGPADVRIPLKHKAFSDAVRLPFGWEEALMRAFCMSSAGRSIPVPFVELEYHAMDDEQLSDFQQICESEVDVSYPSAAE